MNNPPCTDKILPMRTKIGKQYILIPIIYIVIITVLLHFQYSTDESFIRTIGNITVNGEEARAAITGKRGLSSLSIDAYGFSFSFNASDPVLVETRDGLTHKFYALDFTPYTDGVEVDLGKGMAVRFLQEDESLRIIPTASMIESIQCVKFPVTKQPGIEVRSGSGLPVLAITDELLGETHFAAMEEGIRYDEEAGYFVLETGDYGFRELAFRSAPPGIEDPFTFWFAGKANFPDRTEYEAAVRDYLSDARNGWESQRFNREIGTWDTGRDSDTFSEDIAVILLSEAVGTGRFSRVHENMTIASAEHKEQLSRLSSPFLGDIINRVNGFIRSDNFPSRFRSLLDKARQGDTTLFEEDDLIRTIRLSEDRRLSTEAMNILADANLEETSAASGLGILEYLLAFRPEGYTDLLSNTIDLCLVPSLIVLDEGVFLSSGDRENLDVLMSLRAGSLLLEAGRVSANETYEALGRSLVVTAVSLKEDSGFLPQVIQTDGLSIRRRNGVLSPEQAYPYLTDNRYYPREVSTADSFGDGSWIWTCAEDVSVTPGKDMYSITFSYPRGETHYIALHGVPPFSRMRLLGIDWKGDPIFQYYYSGWYYDPVTSTLFIKLRHRSEAETVELYYDRPAPVEPAEQTPTEESVPEG